MSRGIRSPAAKEHRRQWQNENRRKRRHEHPVFSNDELGTIRKGIESEEWLWTPDRSGFREDLDRQEAIRAHAARVGRK